MSATLADLETVEMVLTPREHRLRACLEHLAELQLSVAETMAALPDGPLKAEFAQQACVALSTAAQAALRA